jgi:hypothetical protein
VTVRGTAPGAYFATLPTGTHHFAVTVEYATSHATVAATASNSIVVRHPRRGPFGWLW